MIENPEIVKDNRGRKAFDPNDLRVIQLRILGILQQFQCNSGSTAITIEEISKKLSISVQSIRQGLGPIRQDRYESHNQQHGYRCLLSRGLVIITSIGKEHRYYLSVTGQRIAEDMEDEIKIALSKKPRSAGLKYRVGPKVPKLSTKKHKKRPIKRTKEDIQSNNASEKIS